MNNWNQKPYHSLDYHYHEMFGGKAYKLSIQGGMSCPNRDGTISTGGCIFCSSGGSGDFTFSEYSDTYICGMRKPDISTQIQKGKELLRGKKTGDKYIAYFQAFTNTYAPVEYLREIYYEAINAPDIVGLAIGTRPDCLSLEILNLLEEINNLLPVYVELGLQTTKASTAKLINRGYDLPVFDKAISELNARNIRTVVHVILGLPGEDKKDMLSTVEYVVAKNPSAIKLSLLYILRDTKIYELWEEKPELFYDFSMESYAGFIVDIIEKLPKNIVVQRFTGDGPKKLLVSPLWTADKKRVLNTIMKEFATRNTWQGKYYEG